MLWSIESCQNKVSADQYHLAVSWALLSTHPGRVFFDVIRFKLLVFRGSQAQLEVYFLKFIWIVLCLCHYGPALLTFWFQTNFGRENSASYLKMQAGKTDAFHFSHHSHALVTLHVQYLCPDWSKFDRWVHAENSYLKLVCFDSWSWQSFVTTCNVFNCLFRLDVQNEIQLLSEESSVIHDWLLYWIIVWEMRCLSKSEFNFGWHRFCFSPCWMRKRAIKAQGILALLDSFQELLSKV